MTSLERRLPNQDRRLLGTRWGSMLAGLGGLIGLAHGLAGGGALAINGSAREPQSEPPPIARAGDRSVVLHWGPLAEARPGAFEVFRADRPGDTPRRLASLPSPHFADTEVANDATYTYFFRARWPEGTVGESQRVVASPHRFTSDAEFLELLQATAFDYFWHEANPRNGLVRDRSTAHSFCSIAAVGFGLTALGVGIDHGWITRAQGRQRARTTLQTFADGPQGTNAVGCMGYRGWFYHFLDMNTALRFKQVELSSIDSALFLAGAIYAREYFAGEHPDEVAIRGLADRLVERIDWRWMANEGRTLSMGWHPESGFLESRWVGYNEAMILYVLGLGVQANPLSESFWTDWTRGYRWQTHYGRSYVTFAPLFGHQYSHCWVDFRGLADAYLRERGMTYFENSRRATLAQRDYAIHNPKGWLGYGPELWGLTACDGPGRGRFLAYAARGAPPAENDDGTVAPTAAGGSIPFAPVESLAVLRNLYDSYRSRLWTPYGFRDAFNLSADWWDPDVLGIDQGPILLMIENHRAGAVWNRFMKSPVIQNGLRRAGFQATAPARPD